MAGDFIALTEDDCLRAADVARQRASRYSEAGPYGSNALPLQEMGAQGELAVVRWAERLGLDVVNLAELEDMDSACDVVIEDMRIEVKTFSNRNWPQRQATVLAYQLERIRNKADGLVFCRAPSFAHGGHRGGGLVVELVGWLPVDEYLQVAVAYFDSDLRAQVRVTAAALEHPGSLADHVRSPIMSCSSDQLTKAGPRSCGHRGSPGPCFLCVIPKAAPVSVLVAAGPDLFHKPDLADVVRAHGDASPVANSLELLPFADIAGVVPPCGRCFAKEPVSEPKLFHGLRAETCPTCWLTLPGSGTCDYCS